MPTPPIPVPPGQRIAWMFPQAVASDAIGGAFGPPYNNGFATGTLTPFPLGQVQQTAGSPLGNVGWSTIFSNFLLSLPLGATITHVFPVIQSLTSQCPDVVPFAQYGTRGAPLNLHTYGLGGANFAFLNNGVPAQVTLPNPSGGGLTAWDTNFQIGIQTLQTASSGPYVDTITALRPCFAVYYSGGSMPTPVPTATLINSGPTYPDDCVYESRSQRKLATLVVDWTQQPILGATGGNAGMSNVTLPEFVYNATTAAAVGHILYGYQMLEVDLSTFVGGVGLDECRSVMFMIRPQWGITDNAGALSGPSDNNGPTMTAPNLLTNETTQQCIGMGNWSASSVYTTAINFEAGCKPFFAIGRQMKVRLLNFINNYDATAGAPVALGRITLVFANFDVNPWTETFQTFLREV